MLWLWYFPFSFIALRLFYVAPNYPAAHALYGFGALILGLFWLCHTFKRIPYHAVIEKIIVFNILMYHILTIIFYSFAQFHRTMSYDPVSLMLYWGETISITASKGISDYIFYMEISCVPIIMICNRLLINKMIMINRLETDILDNKHIFLGIAKPKNYMSIPFSLLKMTPVSGFNIYFDGYVYAFKKGHKRVQQIPFDKLNKNNFWFLNTGREIEDVDFKDLSEQQWNLYNNCIIVFNRFIGESIFDLIRRRIISNG